MDDAFLIFSCIFLQKYPSEAPNLLKYCSIVREIYTLSSDGAWRTYDENFRRLRQSSNLPWQNPVEELRIKAMSKSKGHNTNDSFRKSKQFNKGGKVCFAYNRGDKCRSFPCQYPHICQQCKGPHPKFNCTEPSYTKKSKSNITSAHTNKLRKP